MKTIIILSLLIILIIVFVPSKEKFKNNIHYPAIHQYHKNSYKYGLHGRNKKMITFGKFADYIPFISHVLL